MVVIMFILLIRFEKRTIGSIKTLITVIIGFIETVFHNYEKQSAPV